LRSKWPEHTGQNTNKLSTVANKAWWWDDLHDVYFDCEGSLVVVVMYLMVACNAGKFAVFGSKSPNNLDKTFDGRMALPQGQEAAHDKPSI